MRMDVVLAQNNSMMENDAETRLLYHFGHYVEVFQASSSMHLSTMIDSDSLVYS